MADACPARTCPPRSAPLQRRDARVEQGRLVGEAIESVLAQTCDDFELLVVDDGSTDGLESRGAVPEAPRGAAARRPHRGVCAARNAGLAAATGSTVAYLDSDNRWRPEFLERMAEALDASGARLAYCDFNVYHRHPPTAGPRFAGGRSPTVRLQPLLDDNLIDINTLVHDRSLLDEAAMLGRAARAHERLGLRPAADIARRAAARPGGSGRLLLR